MGKFKSIFWILMAVTLIESTDAVAQESSSKKRVGKITPKKVNIKNLEKKYWAPKEGRFKVVQNRTYTKTKRLHLSILPGVMLNEEYSQGFSVAGALGYYFNDRWGLEAEYQFVDLSDNDLQKAVLEREGFADSSRVLGYYGIVTKFMPFYAKMSLLGYKIIYFELSFGASLGMINYQPRQIDTKANTTLDLGDEKSAIAYGFEVSQSFYLSRKLLIRADYKQRYFNEEVLDGGSTEQGGKGDKKSDRIQDSISLNIGFTYIF